MKRSSGDGLVLQRPGVVAAVVVRNRPPVVAGDDWSREINCTLGCLPDAGALDGVTNGDGFSVEPRCLRGGVLGGYDEVIWLVLEPRNL